MSDKVAHFLFQFSKADRKHFRSFLESPIFNRREKVVVLYDFVIAHLDGKPNLELDEEAAFKKIYPKEPFVVNKIRKLKSALLELVLEFLAFRNWKENDNSEVNLLRALNEIGEDTYFPSYYQKAAKNLEKEKLSLQSMSDKVFLEMERSGFESQKGRGGNTEFIELMQSVEASELTRILKFTFIALVREKIIGEQSCPQAFRELIDQVDPQNLRNPLSKMYYLLCATLSPTSSWEDLHSLMATLQEYGNQIDSLEIRDIYLGAINNFNRQESLPKSEVFPELWTLNWDMYELLVKSRGFSLSNAQYKNMVMIGCRLGKFVQVKDFLQEASGHLSGSEAEAKEVQGFNQGVLDFYQENYEAAERAFNQTFKKIPDIFYELDARAYLLMIYFQTGNTIGMESLMHSFRIYLEREERVSSFHQKSYGDFIRFYRRMVSLRPDDKKKIEKLGNEITQSEMRTGQNWLLDKLQAL